MQLGGRDNSLLRQAARRPVCGASRRRLAPRSLRVAAFWPHQSGKSDNDFTDDEILTAAAMTGRRGSGKGRQQEAAQSVALEAGSDSEATTARSPWQFAAAFAFVTVGAFLMGRTVRKYILQPSPSADLSTDSPPLQGRRREGRGPPSVQDLLRRGGGDAGPSVPEPPAGRDALLSSAATETSRAAKAARSATASSLSPPPPAVETATPAAAAAAAPSPTPSPPAVPAQLQAAVASVAAAAAAANRQAPPPPPAPAAAQQPAQQQQPAAQQQEQQPAAAQQQQLEQQQQQQKQPALEPEPAPAKEQVTGLESWCEVTLGPAVAAADAAVAAADAAAAAQAAAAAAAEANLSAAPLLALENAWVLCLQRPDGATAALRLAMPVPEGGEQMCVAVFEDEADAAVAQRALLDVAGLPTVLQALPAARLVADVVASGWGVALYAAGGGVADAVGEAIDAAVRLEILGSARQMSKQLGVESEVADQLPAEEGEGRAEPAELLQRALQGWGMMLGARSVADAAELLAAQQAALRQEVQDPLLAQQQQAAQLGFDCAAAQPDADCAVPQQPAAVQPAVVEPAVMEPAIAEPAAAQQPAAVQPAAEQQAAAKPAGSAAAPQWDPKAERLPRRHASPNWWLALPVLHVPQLVYADGSKGLMSVRCSLPMYVDNGAGASASSSSGSSNGSGSGNGGSPANGSGGGGQATAAKQSDILLVAFADIKDAEPLADCALPQGGPGSPTAIQIISVAPEQLRRHAESSSCCLAALPARALVLAPQASYEQAVQAVQAAAERQWHDELLAAAEQAA